METVLAVMLPVAAKLISDIVNKMMAEQSANASPEAIEAYLQAGAKVFQDVLKIKAELAKGSTAYSNWTAADFDRELTPETWDAGN